MTVERGPAFAVAAMTPSDISGQRPVPSAYHAYVRHKIEAGLADLRTGRVHTQEKIRREFGLDSGGSRKPFR